MSWCIFINDNVVPFLKDKKSLGYSLIGSLNNDDDDVTENDKKAKGLVGKTKALHVHHAFLYISWPSLYDYNVKLPNFTFCGGHEHKATNFSFSFPELRYSLLKFNSTKNYQHLTKWSKWIKCDTVWSSATSLFKWRFRDRRRRCCLNSLLNIGDRRFRKNDKYFFGTLY